MKIYYLLLLFAFLNTSFADEKFSEDNCAEAFRLISSVVLDKNEDLIKSLPSENSREKNKEIIYSLSVGYADKCPSHFGLQALAAHYFFSINEDKALEYLKKSESYEDESISSQALLALVLGSQNKIKESVEQMLKTLDIVKTKENKNYLFSYCSLLENYGEYSVAVKACSYYIESMAVSFRGDAFYVRARAYEKLGEEKLASDDYHGAELLGYDLIPFYGKQHYGQKKESK